MPACLQCQGEKVTSGKIAGSEFPGGVFRPDSLRFWTFTAFGGVLLEGEAFACQDCGLVWTTTPPDLLRMFIALHCQKPEP